MTQQHPPYVAALQHALQPHQLQHALKQWAGDAHYGDNNSVGMPMAAPLIKQQPQECPDAACAGGSMAPMSPMDEDQHEETMVVDLDSIMMAPCHLLQQAANNAAAASMAAAALQYSHAHAHCHPHAHTHACSTSMPTMAPRPVASFHAPAQQPRPVAQHQQHQHSRPAAQQQQPRPAQQQQQRGSGPIGSQQWLYALVASDFLFKPCPTCMHTHTGREVLMTYFDIDAPTTRGYCTYCPDRHRRPRLLQIRRSTYHEVIKAGDIARLADISGIQHYVINGSKVLFLNPRPQPRPPKGVVAPARCAVDGRQLMDHGSTYCSLRCKLEIEDAEFASHIGKAGGSADALHGARGGDQQRPGGPAPARPPIVRTVVKRPAASDAMDVDTGDDQGVLRWGAARGKRRTSDGGRRASENGDGVRANGNASPTASGDSGRSSTCIADCRWHRRKGEPTRSPLQ